MEITVTCPNCNQIFGILPFTSNVSKPCPSCGNTLVITKQYKKPYVAVICSIFYGVIIVFVLSLKDLSKHWLGFDYGYLQWSFLFDPIFITVSVLLVSYSIELLRTKLQFIKYDTKLVLPPIPIQERYLHDAAAEHCNICGLRLPKSKLDLYIGKWYCRPCYLKELKRET